MRAFVIIVLCLIGLWIIAWQEMNKNQVGKLQQTIVHQHERLKSVNDNITLEVEKVRASGFPFASRVALIHPKLGLREGNEVYAISLPKLELVRVDETTYQLRNPLPQPLEALYQKNGQPPEKYSVTWNEDPEIFLAGLAEEQPLTRYGVKLPRQLLLTAELNGESKKIVFNFIPLPKPIYNDIPADAARPLTLFIGMLREAMIYQ